MAKVKGRAIKVSDRTFEDTRRVVGELTDVAMQINAMPDTKTLLLAIGMDEQYVEDIPEELVNEPGAIGLLVAAEIYSQYIAEEVGLSYEEMEELSILMEKAEKSFIEKKLEKDEEKKNERLRCKKCGMKNTCDGSRCK